MKTNYEISIVNNDIHKNECLSEIVNNLEKLEIFADDIFNRINKKLIEKKTKIENLKSRIHRANQIISSFENLTQAITIKSKKRYPEKTDLNQTSLYYDDLCDFKLLKSFKIPFTEINQKPFNSSASLGKAPLGSLEDVKTTQEIINDIPKFSDTSSQIAFSLSSPKALDSSLLPENAEKFASYFDFIEKKQVFGKSAASRHKDFLQTSASAAAANNLKDSKLMKDFMRSKKKQNVKKPEDEAPVTITSKHQLTRFNKPEEIIRRYTNAELQFNIPMNVNLSHIAQFETNSMSMENYFGEEREVVLAPQAQVVSDDANSYQTPVDMLKSQNAKQANNAVNNNNNNNNNNANYNNPNNNNYNNSQSSNNNTQQFNTNNNTNYNSNNNNNNNYNNNNNNNFNQNINENNTNNQNTSKPQTSNIPKAPPLPSVPTKTSVTMPVVAAAPKIPQAPPVPQVNLPSQQTKIELPQDKDDLRVKIPAVKRASMADEIFFAAERRRNAAKTAPNDPSKKPEEKPGPSGRGGLLEALKSDNPMARLKKAGSLLVKSDIIPNALMNGNEGNKDGEKKNLQSLEEQIRMRFNMLNKNNMPAKNKKKKNQDTDSFSDKSSSD